MMGGDCYCFCCHSLWCYCSCAFDVVGRLYLHAVGCGSPWPQVDGGHATAAMERDSVEMRLQAVLVVARPNPLLALLLLLMMLLLVLQERRRVAVEVVTLRVASSG